MGGAAYFRARNLLRDQITQQTSSLMRTELTKVDKEIKTKEIRLDRFVRRGDLSVLLELGFHSNPRSIEFQEIRNNLLDKFNEINSDVGSLIFNQFFLLDPDGSIRISSNPEWEGKSIINADAIKDISASGRSRAIISLDPLFTGKFMLLTAVDYHTKTGSTLGTVVGITESENLQGILESLLASIPSAKAYFIVPPDQYVTNDPYTHELTIMNTSPSQKSSLDPVLAAMMGQDNPAPASVEFKDINGQPVLTQVEWIPVMRAGAALELNQQEIYGPINSLIPFTILLIVAALLATGIVLAVGTNRVIKPLRTLNAITRRFAEGDWSGRAEVTHGEDEISLLANSFNHMADELSDLYHSLEQKVDERTRQIRTAAAVAQNITALTNLDDLLYKIVELLIDQFEFYEAHIFMIDRPGKYAVLRAAAGPAAKNLLESGHRLEVGSDSIIGWVSANNQSRVASDVSEDPVHLKNDLLPETRAEASVPISIGKLVLGVLDVQSTHAGAFSAETLVMLETLTSQIAAAIQNVGLLESSQVNFQELARLYRSSQMIAAARSEEEVLEVSGRLLRDAPFPVALLAARKEDLEILTLADTSDVVGATVEFQRYLKADVNEIQGYLSSGPVIAETTDNNTPDVLLEIVRHLGFSQAAYLPIVRGKELAAVIILGATKQAISYSLIQPYANLADLVSATLEKLAAGELTQTHLKEMEALASLSQAVSTTSDLNSFYKLLHAQVREIIGDYHFTISLYDEKKDAISVPYDFDDNQLTAMESFPMGEGLSSILIRTRQPLMLVEDTEKQAARLGAKIVGRPALSWMGAPMLVQNQVIGVLTMQDLDHEHAFNDDHLRFLTAVAGQVAGVINNVRLLDDSLQRSLQLETAAEIARDISGSLNLDELLVKSVNFIRERFNFYHAAIFLIDLSGEFAVIREATGDAGAQMKRMGHKIGVGSKSIVGYVSGQGERLVVNDTSKDATYYANPLLPDTRAEVAIPLKVGDRIMGVLDVQSTYSYAFQEDNLRSLQILADQLAVAVVNTELFAETQEHLSQSRLLHHITTTAASGTTLEEALEGAVSGLQVTLGGDRVAILLVDNAHKALEIKAVVGFSEDVSKLRIPIGNGITGWVAAHRRPLRINDVSKDPRYIQGSPNTCSELAVPLLYRNTLLGVLNVESEQTDAYTENDEEMLGTLGGSLAAIIANARLLEQIRAQAERERLVYEITAKIRRSTDIQSILATTASELNKVVGARRTKIEVLSKTSDLDGSNGS
jgi:GAF domain-containing protein/HAMP domain-containing protein